MTSDSSYSLPSDAMNTSKSLDSILYSLQRLAEPNGLITSDIEWAKQAIVEAVEGLIGEDEVYVKSMGMTEMHDIATRNTYRDFLRQAIKEWQDYGG